MEIYFKSHETLSNDKLFSIQDVIDIVEKSRKTGLSAEYLIEQYLQPKTQWNIVLDSNNQNKLS